jgi:hypothetical protein
MIHIGMARRGGHVPRSRINQTVLYPPSAITIDPVT